MMAPRPQRPGSVSAVIGVSRWEYRTASRIVAAVIGSILVGLLATAMGEASLSRTGELFLWLFVLAGVAITSYFLIRRSPVEDLDLGWLYFVPVLVLIVATSLLETGVSGILPHQLAWGSLAIVS